MENPCELPSEEELIERAQLRDHDAFAELVRRTTPYAMRLALSILRDPQEAEDEVQNSYFNAWKSVGSFHGDAKFSTWMSRIVTNQCLMRLRKLSQAAFVYLDDLTDTAPRRPHTLPDPGLDPEARLADSQVSGILRHEIAKMPGILREVVELRDLAEFSMDEVAARLDITVPAVKSRLRRARLELRDRLTRCADQSLILNFRETQPS